MYLSNTCNKEPQMCEHEQSETVPLSYMYNTQGNKLENLCKA